MIEIGPGAIAGRVRAPASKSLTQRAILLASVAEGESVLRHTSPCEDAGAALRAARALGARVKSEGTSLRISGGAPLGGRVDCGESGFCIRAVPPLAALAGAPFLLEAHGSLARRPVGMIEAPLLELGAECSTEGGLPPVRMRGPLRGGSATVDGSETSQFLSGLLMALPRCPSDSVLQVQALKSRPYVAMTVEMVRAFGGRLEHVSDFSSFRISGAQKYRATEVQVEGDWSGASLLLVAGAVAGEIAVEGLRRDSLQADRALVDALALSGARVEWRGSELRVARGQAKPFEFDSTESPDLFPALAVLACACGGESRIAGAARLRHKETDRASALVEELGKAGGRLRIEGDILCVEGADLRGGQADSRGDHRIAMALAVAGLLSREGVRIRDEACVAKSYPGFFEDLERIQNRD